MFLYTIQHVWDFPCFPFFRQKSPEIDVETQSKKIIEKSWSGHPFWEPKSMKIDAGKLQKRLNCEKMSFLQGTVFSSFFRYIFRWNLGPPGVHGGGPKIDFSAAFFDFFCAGVLFSRFPAILDRFWSILVDFGPFWVDFLCFFEVNFQMKHRSDIRLFNPNFSFCRVTLIRATDEHLISKWIDTIIDW